MKIIILFQRRGVRNNYFDKNISGGKIDLKDKRNVVSVGKRYLPAKQSDRIKKFARHCNK